MTDTHIPKTLRVGVAGLGAIGTRVAEALGRGDLPGMALTAVAARDAAKAESRLAKFAATVPVVDAGALAATCDLVVECVPKAAFLDIAKPVLAAGKTLVTVSGAAILANPDIVDHARRNGGRIILATGALLGLDAVRAAAEGTINSVRMVTRKPPKSLRGAPYLEQHDIDVMSLTGEQRIFAGTAAEGAIGFPSNVNVAAAVGLAGIGADSTKLEIWADPEVRRNTHTIYVDADSASFEMKIENVPSEENPGTGKITALSVIAALRAESSTLRVGT